MSSGDFSRVVELKQERPLVDQEKYYLLKNHFRPNFSYRFPSVLYGSRHRSFQHSWLTQYNGLVYSELAREGTASIVSSLARHLIQFLDSLAPL